MIKSNEINELAVALCKVQNTVGVIHRTATGQIGKRKYQYTPLDSLLTIVKPKLEEHGLAVVQLPGDRRLRTMLLHTSGQYIGSEMSLEMEVTGDPQAQGSAITYARRYALIAILNLAPDSDDDGAAAKPQPDSARQTHITPTGLEALIKDAQYFSVLEDIKENHSIKAFSVGDKVRMKAAFDKRHGEIMAMPDDATDKAMRTDPRDEDDGSDLPF